MFKNQVFVEYKMDYKLWDPPVEDGLIERVDSTLKDNKVSIRPYKGKVPSNDTDFIAILNKIRGIELKGVNYFTDFRECHFKGGGVERTLGRYHYRDGEDSLHIDVGSFLTTFDFPCLYEFEDIPESERDNFDIKKFVSLYSEVHLIDRGNLEIPSLGTDTRLSYFLLPGLIYLEQPYIKSLNLEHEKKVIKDNEEENIDHNK